MKKTWKQWIAIACVLSMIACMLPAMTLAEDGVATPTDLAPITEEPAGEEPTEETGDEPEGEIPSPGIPELQFGKAEKAVIAVHVLVLRVLGVHQPVIARHVDRVLKRRQALR